MKSNTKSTYLIGIIILLIVAVINEYRIANKDSNNSVKNIFFDDFEKKSITCTVDPKIEGCLNDYFKIITKEVTFFNHDQNFIIELEPIVSNRTVGSYNTYNIRLNIIGGNSADIDGTSLTSIDLQDKLQYAIDKQQKIKLLFRVPYDLESDRLYQAYLEDDCQ